MQNLDDTFTEAQPTSTTNVHAYPDVPTSSDDSPTINSPFSITLLGSDVTNLM